MHLARGTILAAFISGCATTGPAPKVIYDTPELLVRLEPAQTCANGTGGTPFSHPIQLSSQQIRTLLGALLAREKVGLLHSFVQAPGTPRLFDDATLERLTTPIQQAFAQVTPEDAVVFLLAVSASDARSTVTSGALSIRGEVLSIALFNFRHPVRTILSDVGATDHLSDVRETLRYVRQSPCVSIGEQDFALFFEEPHYQTQTRSGSLVRYPERTLSIAYQGFLATHADMIRGERDILGSPANTASNRADLQAIADLKRRIAELERRNQALTDRTPSHPSADAASKTLTPATDTAPPSPADTQTRLMEIMKSLETRVSELERRIGQDSPR
ncbi:MAG: hypothetical protein KIT40_11325 [Nitrospira sp.]|nr:hypothetical protein [Nitrospira sp.]